MNFWTRIFILWQGETCSKKEIYTTLKGIWIGKVEPTDTLIETPTRVRNLPKPCFQIEQHIGMRTWVQKRLQEATKLRKSLLKFLHSYPFFLSDLCSTNHIFWVSYFPACKFKPFIIRKAWK